MSSNPSTATKNPQNIILEKCEIRVFTLKRDLFKKKKNTAEHCTGHFVQ
jgi:hypothetical protein